MCSLGQQVAFFVLMKTKKKTGGDIGMRSQTLDEFRQVTFHLRSDPGREVHYQDHLTIGIVLVNEWKTQIMMAIIISSSIFYRGNMNINL